MVFCILNLLLDVQTFSKAASQPIPCATFPDPLPTLALVEEPCVVGYSHGGRILVSRFEQTQPIWRSGRLLRFLIENFSNTTRNSKFPVICILRPSSRRYITQIFPVTRERQINHRLKLHHVSLYEVWYLREQSTNVIFKRFYALVIFGLKLRQRFFRFGVGRLLDRRQNITN